MSKKYQLEKLNDILDIPSDSLDDFFIDLRKWHSITNNLKDMAEALGQSRDDVGSRGFVWKDDGKHDAKITLVGKEDSKDD